MKLESFCVPYMIDERMNYTAEHLQSLGYQIVDSTDDADFVVLPIPAKEYMFNNISDKPIFFGSGKFNGYDYNLDESFKIKNAYLTSEGAITLLKNNSDTAIYGSNVLITGYGRVANALHKALVAMGASVTVCCRSNVDKIKAANNYASVIGFDELKNNGCYDFVFNTVPHLVFTKKELDALNNDTLIFDLASFPGGVDTLYAKSKKLKLIDGRSLPARYSKITAGKLIAKSIDSIIKEELA